MRTAATGIIAIALGLGTGAVAQQQPGVPPRTDATATATATTTGAANVQAVPEGQVRIAIDTDNDGKVDRVETIDIFELEQARHNSAARHQKSQENSPDGLLRVTGPLAKMKSVQLAGIEGEQQIGRIKESNGDTVRVHLGSKADLASLNLKDGDTVTVVGSVGLINDRPVLIAHRVESGGKSVSVTLPDDRGIQRIHGQVLSTRKAKFRGREGEHVIARIRLLDGGQVPAILGPAAALNALEIHDGSTLDLLVRPGRLNDEPALVAEQVRSKDQVVTIPRPASSRGEDFETRPGDPPATTAPAGTR